MSRKGDKTKELIREKAAVLFAQKGFKEVTMKDICEASGLSRGGLYRHYESTEQIFSELMDCLLKTQENEFTVKMEQGQSAVRILDEILKRYQDEMIDSGASLSVAIYEYFSRPHLEAGDNALQEKYRSSACMWRELIQYGIKRNEFRPVSWEAVFDLIVFSYQGVRMYSKLMPIDPGIPKRITDQIRQLLIGFRSFDPAEKAFINPADITKPLPDFPKICVSTFSEAIIEKYAAREGVTKIAELYTANGALPVYRTVYGGTPIAFFLSRVGAPACAAGLEEIIALGARKIVLFGSCGILNESRMEGRFLIPTAAVREEGTSFHYALESEEIPMEPSSVRAVTKCLDTCGYPYVTGKVWTMDAIYRETADKIERRRNQGCLAVEMECAAAIAVTRFRGVKFAQFLYGADNLDSDIWEPRDLTDYGMTNGEKYLSLAFECGLAL